ncbi:MAG: FAD-dependent oxidoreductase, partial [Hyphomicrobiales bacterium]|nr:FAD-dependent oxidoreductase [Hyphomicrobiales bacterium]
MTAGAERKALFKFDYRRSADQDAAAPVRHPVVIVGAGPVGLATAIDLTQRGVRVTLLDDADRIGEGSRGLCYSKRTLEILDRLGAGRACVEKGVVWKIGKNFFRDEQVYQFDLLPEAGHKQPAFINLQQYYLESFLLARAAELNIDVRWRNRVCAASRAADGVTLEIDTPDGKYALTGDWVVAADGARSTLRALAGLEWRGQAFEDRFLIADVKMHGDFPPERWFWFEPPFHAGHSALLHKQPDDVWRIDLQLGADADASEEQQPERVIARIKQMLKHDDFELEWVSLYTFQCRRIDRFVHGRLVFAGDSAHQVSPFGARGANSGVQDAENLAWKLAMILKGEAPESLIESYDAERSQAADENILHSTRSTDFIAPRSAQELRFRDAALALARSTGFGKRMINSGRLSTPKVYDTPLSTSDGDAWAGPMAPGAVAQDAPLLDAQGAPVWLLDALGGEETLIVNGEAPRTACRTLVLGRDLVDAQGL